MTQGSGPIIAVGIDVALPRRGLDLVVLDGDRTVVEHRGRLTRSEVTRMVLRDLQPGIVCIDSPSGWATSGGSRQAERELRALGINCYYTPSDPGDNPFYDWVKVGISIFEALSGIYPLFRGESLAITAAEVFPHASATLLAGEVPSRSETEAFRRNVLRSNGVDEAVLPTLDRVDAALGALTGILALEGTYSTVGDPNEGVILLPVKHLPESPLGRSQPSGHGNPSEKLCQCGCGAAVSRRFLPGHDAKLKSRLKRECRDGDEDACRRLRELGWTD
jgi:predicted nuclease with RNAse H fold